MPTLPALDIKTNINHSPHIVILGAGASKAAFLKGDANGKAVPVMCELIEYLNLGPLLKSHNLYCGDADFESLYDDLVSSGKYPESANEIEARVQEYFSQLCPPDRATIYDYLVLSLREKDLIASFSWDPFLALAWQRNSRAVKLPKMVHLHGNVEIAVCLECRVKDFKGKICKKCRKLLIPTPLLYPVKQKNYSAHPFIEAEWNELRFFLKHTYFLTIFGYAAPETDVEARKLLLNAWKDNPTFELAQIEIIDIKPEEKLTRKWKEFFCRDHYGIFKSIWSSYLFRYPRRSCEAFAMATLQQSPWRVNPFPKTTNLRKLQEWARLLWFEENDGKLSGKPFDYL
ncbi:MAG: hypothetical protein NTV82_18950 [Candidatus Aminicenantes bacterium]|nr:hypothetical protein [Candidatus Aminicenantes bacterium]